jgi:hypothetical protein
VTGRRNSNTAGTLAHAAKHAGFGAAGGLVAATIKAASGSRERSRQRTSGGGSRSKSRGGECTVCTARRLLAASTPPPPHLPAAGPAGLPPELRSLVRSREGAGRRDSGGPGGPSPRLEGSDAGAGSGAGGSTPRPVGTPDSAAGLPAGLRAGGVSSRHLPPGSGASAVPGLPPGTARLPVAMTTVLVAGPDSMLTSRGAMGVGGLGGDGGATAGSPSGGPGGGLPPRPGSKAGMGIASVGSPGAGASPGRVPTLRNVPTAGGATEGAPGSARDVGSSRKGVTNLLITGPGMVTARTGESVDGQVGPYTSRTGAGSAYDGNPAISGRLDAPGGAANRGLTTVLISGPGDISTVSGHGGSMGLRTVASSNKLPASRWTTEGGPGVVQGRLPPVTAVVSGGADAYAGEAAFHPRPLIPLDFTPPPSPRRPSLRQRHGERRHR